ncbi:hypothetical protein M3Y96_00361100 [Aphelenchoides besseyi]|nr:hypothetical protein M3Y96_00361100 [Aphelenchoides besseyi]
MSTTDFQTDFVTHTSRPEGALKLQEHWVKHLSTFEIAMISGTRESFPESEVAVNDGRAIYYKPDQFEHRGALIVKREMNFEKDGKTDPALDVDTNPKDAHFYFTEKEGNVVFDVGSQVECVVP